LVNFLVAGFPSTASPEKLRVMLQSCSQLSGASAALPVIVIAAETRTDLLFFEE
jgi:hypothetical protein